MFYQSPFALLQACPCSCVCSKPRSALCPSLPLSIPPSLWRRRGPPLPALLQECFVQQEERALPLLFPSGERCSQLPCNLEAGEWMITANAIRRQAMN